MATTNRATAIEPIVEQGLRSLRKCLWDNSLRYWPQEGENNGLPERNLSLHVAHSFLEHGWLVFAEASFPDRIDRRIDLLALKEGILVATECKQLDSPDRAAELAGDINELRDFRLTTAWNTKQWQAPTISTRFGLLLVNTWSLAIKKWWWDQITHLFRRAVLARAGRILEMLWTLSTAHICRLLGKSA